MVRDSFACFIICHGRPDKTVTFNTLKRVGYTGKTYIICDDEDDTVDKYREVFGNENVVVFSKAEIEKHIDTMDITNDRRCTVYVRNACFDIAKNLGLTYFCVLDDDYTDITIRIPVGKTLPVTHIYDLDSIFELYLDFLDTSNSIASVAFAQAGDFIGGYGCQMNMNGYKRKCMNSWICRTDRKIDFIGRMNDDVNAYAVEGARGKIFITFPQVSINQVQTQANDGGMTDIYINNGTYQKSFYTIMCAPSASKISVMGRTNFRVHHLIEWESAVPKIVSSRFMRE